MKKVIVGPVAAKEIASLENRRITLRWNPRHGFHITNQPGRLTIKGRTLRYGRVAKLRIKLLRRKVIHVHWGPKRGFWTHIQKLAPKRLSKRQLAAKYCHEALNYAGRMYYTEGPRRSELFNRAPGNFLGAGADCSQFVSSIMHWCGITSVNQWDATGTLLTKGKAVAEPAIGRIIIAGYGAGVHTGMFVGQENGEWMIVEFGFQGAPDKVSLANFEAYFRARGQGEFRIRDFFE
jgi:hypothetical protein